MFDKLAYKTVHAQQLTTLRGAEKIVRETLAVMSRGILEAVHHDGDIIWANQVLPALTPVNRKVAIAFFRAFLGFKFSEEKQEFVSKDKKTYEEKHADAVKFLEDPLNNIWTWADRNIEVETKEFDLAKLNQQVGALTKKMAKAKIGNVELLKAAMANGVTIDDIIAVLDAAGYEAAMA